MASKKRYQTYFGIPIPPWKDKKLGAGSTTIRFVITGRVPSKKNNIQSVAIRKDAREYINGLFKTTAHISKPQALAAIKKVYSKVRPNDDYNSFVEATKPILIEQMAEWSARLSDKGLIFPLSAATMTIRFYMKHKHISDTVNRQQSIQDLLIEAGVISNDDYRTLNPIISASACYFEEIPENITFISLSFRL